MPSVHLCLLLLLLPLPTVHGALPPLPDDLEEMEDVPAQVIVRSTACSATCGLGVRQQEVCPLQGGQVVKGALCQMRWVRCMDSWQCGLQTVTGAERSRVELDCLGEVMEAMGRYSFRVSWRYARGIVTSDDSFFKRYSSPQLDRVVLDPLWENNSGTYRCDVQDSTFHLVKRVYKGVRVMLPQVLSLDYSSALASWDEQAPSLHPNLTVVTGPPYTNRAVRNMVLLSLVMSAVLAGLIVLGLYVFVLRREWWRSCVRRERVLLARTLPHPDTHTNTSMGAEGGEQTFTFTSDP